MCLLATESELRALNVSRRLRWDIIFHEAVLKLLAFFSCYNRSYAELQCNLEFSGLKTLVEELLPVHETLPSVTDDEIHHR